MSRRKQRKLKPFHEWALHELAVLSGEKPKDPGMRYAVVVMALGQVKCPDAATVLAAFDQTTSRLRRLKELDFQGIEKFVKRARGALLREALEQKRKAGNGSDAHAPTHADPHAPG